MFKRITSDIRTLSQQKPGVLVICMNPEGISNKILDNALAGFKRENKPVINDIKKAAKTKPKTGIISSSFGTKFYIETIIADSYSADPTQLFYGSGIHKLHMQKLITCLKTIFDHASRAGLPVFLPQVLLQFSEDPDGDVNRINKAASEYPQAYIYYIKQKPSLVKKEAV